MAKQLYDYWFLQFDFPDENGKPYKSSGGKMVWNEKLKREIPEGWDGVFLNDFLIIKNGRDHKLLATGNYPVYGSGGEMRRVSAYLYNGETILMPRKGSLNNIMYVNRAFWTVDTMFYSEMKIPHCAKYVFFSIKDIDFTRWDSGTGVPSMTASLLYSIPIVKPNDTILQTFDKILFPIFQKLEKVQLENESLTTLRDSLLPLLMNGQVEIGVERSRLNYDLSSCILSIFSYNRIEQSRMHLMNKKMIDNIVVAMSEVLEVAQQMRLRAVLQESFAQVVMSPAESEKRQRQQANEELLQAFIAAKKIEGCSEKTLHYYTSTIEALLNMVQKRIDEYDTNDIRTYLSHYQEERGSSRVTIDNLRRIFSSFFAWLEDEDYIAKSPVRRIHKVRTESLVKEVLNDEHMEVLRDSCTELRDLAMIDLLASTGVRVGELVQMNCADIDFHERQCVVLGKGNKEREVYFNARTKIHLQRYLESRRDQNPALFVALSSPHNRLTIGGIEARLRQLGKRVGLNKVHPHKFRRTLATMAIDKGMPIEQVQRLLGHVKIDTTLHYAMVNQTNVKMAHRKYIS